MTFTMETSVQTYFSESPQYRPRMLYFGVTSGARQVQTLTFPATAGATQGDFVLVYNEAGQTEALWLDIDGDGTAPTADEYVNADFQTVVAISTGDTDAQVAAAAEAASQLPDITIVDNTDGTLTVTQDVYGPTSEAIPLDADGSGAGSITVAEDVAGLLPVVGNGSPDATIEQTAVGTFVVTFAENFQRAPEVGATVKTDNRVARVTDSTIFAVTIELQNLSGGAAADGNFALIVLGSDAKDAIAQM
jgi:hypothetical protein